MKLSFLTFLNAFLCVLGLTMAGCASNSEINTGVPEGAYKLAEKYEKDERFEEAIAQYAQVKNKYPYSKLATESELRIAEIHFKREEFVEAQSAYQTFKELHPSYPRIDYVTFQLALSFFNQLPSTIDRDLSVAERAILYFDEVMQSYGRSKYASEAANYKLKALKMLAEKEYYIAHFYLIRDRFESALGRFEGLLVKFPKLGFDAQALYGAAYSAYQLKDLGKAKAHYNRLLTDFGGSKEAEKARQELGNHI